MKDLKLQLINGILLLYYHPLVPNAPTIIEHLNAFNKYSQFKVWCINTGLGFPKGLEKIQFTIIVLHYSLFGIAPYQLNDFYLTYLKQSKAYKIAFFQDEYHYCQDRFSFINNYRIDCIYTLLEPEYFKDVYEKYTKVLKVLYTLPGYVDENLLPLAERITIPDEERSIDIGYRGRCLWYYTGNGGREKIEIAKHFIERGRNLGLKLDIEVEENRRIYGEVWYHFLANCRAVLGVEAGVSIFDVEDHVRLEYERLLGSNPSMSFEEMYKILLYRWESNIFYRTISPRHFEAAALGVCQILFEGKYSKIMKPMVHYIPLKKDFSNFDEVIQLFKNGAVRRELTENAYKDLISSGSYSYRGFIEAFDRELLKEGFKPEIDDEIANNISIILGQDQFLRATRARFRAKLINALHGQYAIKHLVKPVLDHYRRYKYYRWQKKIGV
jgi:hypothetical protein